MDRYFDHWERLVEAVMRREELRQLSLECSRSPSTRSIDSDSSFSTSSCRDVDFSFRQTPSHDAAVRLKIAQTQKLLGKETKRRANIWKGFSIFRNGFASKKDYKKEEIEVKWATADRTLLEPQRPIKGSGLSTLSSEIKGHEMDEQAMTRAEFSRLKELYTLKGHIESLVKSKGLDVGSINHYYTV